MRGLVGACSWARVRGPRPNAHQAVVHAAMCIGTSWPASKVAKLSLVFEVAILALGIKLLDQASTRTALGGGVLGTVSIALLAFVCAPKKPGRGMPHFLLVVAVVLHIHSTYTLPFAWKAWSKAAKPVCETDKLRSTAPEISALLANPLSTVGGTAEQVVIGANARIIESEKKFQESIASLDKYLSEEQASKRRKDIAAQETQRWRSFCSAAIQEEVMGSQMSLMQLVTSLQLVAAVLGLLVVSLIYCEDYGERGVKVRRFFFPDEARAAEKAASAAKTS